MANKELIEEFVSESGFAQIDKATKDIALLAAEVAKCIIAAEKLNKTLAGANNFRDFEKAANAAALGAAKVALAEEKVQQAKIKTAQIAAKAAADNERIAAKELAATEKKIKKEQEATEASNKRTQTVISNSQAEIDAYNRTANGVDGVTDSLNDLNRAEAAAANEVTANTNAINQNTTQRAANARTAREAAFLLEEERQNVRRNNAELRVQVREANAVKGSLEQRRAALIRLNNVYDNQSPSERASAAGQRLQTIIQGLTEQVSTLESATGRNQRNVGNYGSALGSVWDGLRQVANVLPGVGIAGLIAFATEPIIEYVKELDIFKKSTKEAAEITALSSSEYKQAIIDVTNLKVAVSDFHKGLITGTQLIDTYNKSIGDTAGQLNTVAAVEKFIKEKSKDYVEAMLLRIRANAALEEAVDLRLKAEKRANDDSSILDYVYATSVAITKFFTLGDAVKGFNDTLKDMKQRGIEELNTKANKSLDIFQQLRLEADAFAKNKGLDLSGNNNKDNTAVLDLQRARVEAERNTQKAIVDNEEKSLDARFGALKNYTKLTNQLNKIDAAKKIANAKGNEKLIALATQEQRTADKNAKIEDEEIKAKINKKATADLKKLLADGYKDLTKREQDDLNLIKDSSANKLTAIEQFRAEAVQGTNEQYAAGKLTEKQYNQQLYDIEVQASKDRVQVQIDELKQSIKLQEESLKFGIGTNKELTDDKAKLAAKEIELSAIATKAQIDDAKKLAAAKKELYEKEKEIAYAVFDLGVTLVDATFTRQNNAIEDQIKLNDTKKAQEIENVNESVLSEEDKANRIAIINARAEAQNVLLEQRQREIKIRQAKFDKAAQIAKAIGATAVAVAEALPNIPLSILVGALGAVQIGTILATPIPKYKDGKDKNNNYSGPAWVGDGYKPELRIDPDGTMSLTPNKPTLTHVSAGTQIIGGDMLERMMVSPSGLLVGKKDSSYDFSLLERAIKESSKETIRAYSKNKSQTQKPIISKRGMFIAQQKFEEMNRYLNR